MNIDFEVIHKYWKKLKNSAVFEIFMQFEMKFILNTSDVDEKKSQFKNFQHSMVFPFLNLN